jgi:hypothetical protein
MRPTEYGFPRRLPEDERMLLLAPGSSVFVGDLPSEVANDAAGIRWSLSGFEVGRVLVEDHYVSLVCVNGMVIRYA